MSKANIDSYSIGKISTKLSKDKKNLEVTAPVEIIFKFKCPITFTVFDDCIDTLDENN